MPTPIDAMIDDYDRGRLSRRQLVAHLTGLVGVLAGAGMARGQDAPAPPAPPAPPAEPTFKGVDLNHIALDVTDLGRSREFYQRHLGLELASQSRRSCFLRCGQRDFLAMFLSERPGLNHYCFSVEGFDAQGAVERLEKAGLEPRRRQDRVYFDDPDRIEVQVAATTHRV